jgi:glycosyltransferase involved in cell wall biosynthesis
MDNKKKRNNTPLVSVVMPVYNTAAYVEDTVRSILTQTLTNIEIVIINDGSTDESPQILERLAAEDSRIRLIQQKNSGQSAGRNVGIANSTAPYLYFMDSDDLLVPDTLERCYNRCREQQLDFVTFDAEPFADDPKEIMSMKYDRSQCLVEHEIYNGAEAIEKQLIEWCFTPSPCLYLVSREFLDSYAMRFYEGIIHEDELFTSVLYLKASRMGYIPEKFFKRRFRSNSTMTSRVSWRNINGYITVAAGLETIRKEMDEHRNRIIDRFLSKMLNAVMWKAHTLPFSDRWRLFRISLARHYTRYVSTRSLLTMMVRKYMKK